jgi:hypothetical protein
MAPVLALTVALLVPCAPAFAQTGPASVQYVGESPETFAENAGPGTDAVNDAMAGTASSASSSASDEPSDEASASPAGAASSSDADASGQTGGNGASVSEADEGLGAITELPETGGASLAALGSGVLLAMSGLMARRLARR